MCVHRFRSCCPTYNSAPSTPHLLRVHVKAYASCSAGHGILWDGYRNEDLERLICDFYVARKTIATCSHGAVALLGVQVRVFEKRDRCWAHWQCEFFGPVALVSLLKASGMCGSWQHQGSAWSSAGHSYGRLPTCLVSTRADFHRSHAPGRPYKEADQGSEGEAELAS